MALPPLTSLPPLHSLEEEEDKSSPLELPPLKTLPPLTSLEPRFEEPQVSFAKAEPDASRVAEPEPRRDIEEELETKPPTATEVYKMGITPQEKMAKEPEPEEPLVDRLIREQRKVLTGPEKIERIKKEEAEAIAKGREIMDSELTPKEYAETEVLGKPEKGLGAEIARTARKFKETPLLHKEINLQSFLGSLSKTAQNNWMSIFDKETRMPRMVSAEEATYRDYLKHKADAEVKKQERKQERQFEEEERTKPIEAVPVVEPDATRTLEQKPRQQPALEPLPLRTLEPPPTGKIKKIVDAIDKGLDKAPEFIGGMLGMIEDIPEMAVGLKMLKLGSTSLAALTKTGARLKEVADVEKGLKALSHAEKLEARRKIASKLAERLTVKGARFGGEVAVFSTPEALKRGEMPTKEEMLHMGLVLMGFKTGAKIAETALKGMGLAVKGVRAVAETKIAEDLAAKGKGAIAKGGLAIAKKLKPKETLTEGQKLINEMENVKIKLGDFIKDIKKEPKQRQSLIKGKEKLKDIELKLNAINYQIKKTSKGRKQRELIRERKNLILEKAKLLAEPKNQLLKQIDDMAESVKTVPEAEALMQAIKEEMKNETIARMPGELNDLNLLFEKIKAKRTSLKTEVPSGKPITESGAIEQAKPSEGVQPKVIKPEAKAEAIEKPKSEAETVKEVRDIEPLKRALKIRYQREGKSTSEATAEADKCIARMDPKDATIVAEILKIETRKAEIDNLTGLKTRNWAERKGLMEDAVDAEGKKLLDTDGEPVRVLKNRLMIMIDMDNFGFPNKKYGEIAGDSVLKDFGSELRLRIGDKTYIIRYGGEEIIVLPHSVSDKASILKELNRLREEFKKKTFADDKWKNQSFSAGIGETFKEADIQMNLAKKSGKDVIFEGGKKYVHEKTEPHTSQDKGTVNGVNAALRRESNKKERKKGGGGKKEKPKQPEPVEEPPESPPVQIDKSGKPIEPETKPRQRGGFSQSGVVGKKTKPQLTEGASKEGMRFQRVMDWMEKKVEESQKVSWREIKDTFMSELVQHEAPWASRVVNSELGRRLVRDFQNSRSANGAAKWIAEDAKKYVMQTVKHGEEPALHNLAKAYRIVEIDKIMAQRKGKKVKLSALEKKMLPEGESPEVWLAKQNKHPGGLTAKEAGKYIEDMKNNYPEMYERHMQALEKYWEFGKEQPKILYREGLIDAEFRDYLIEHHKHYDPKFYLHHMDPKTIQMGPGGNKINVPDSGIRALDRGSEEALINDMGFAIEQIAMRTMNRVFRNRANTSLLDYVKETPDNPIGVKIEEPLRINKTGEPVWGKVPNGYTRISAMVKGKRQNMLMPDEIAKHYSLRDPHISQTLTKIIRWTSGTPILKTFATGMNPEFAFTNLPRDIVYTWFKQHDLYSPIMPLGLAQLGGDMLEVFGDVSRRKGFFKDLMLNGMSMETMVDQGLWFKRKIGQKSTVATEFADQIGEWAGYAGNTSEMLTRTGLALRVLKKRFKLDSLKEVKIKLEELKKTNFKEYQEALAEAAHKARTNLDFAQGGRTIKAIDNGVPYLSASVQGTRGIFQAFKSNPKLATVKASEVMLLSMGLAYWSKKYFPDMYERLSSRERESGWIIPYGSYKFKDKLTGEWRYPYVKVAKDYGQRVFAAVGEAMADIALGEAPDKETLWMAITDFMPLEAVAQIPPTMSAFLSYVNNVDFWRKHPIWTGPHVSPEKEYWEDTGRFWQIAGEQLGMSPERLKVSVEEIIPQTIYSDILNLGWHAVKMDENDKSDINRSIYERMSEFPFSRKFLRLTWPQRVDDLKLAKDIIKLRVPTHNENGQPFKKAEIVKKLKEAEIKRSDYRHMHNIELKRIMLEEFLKPEPTEINEKLVKYLKKIGKEYGPKDVDEVKRLAERYARNKAAYLMSKHNKKKPWQNIVIQIESEING